MDNQKRENLLNLALDATEEERLKSVNLNVGYDPGEKTWELIVRYNGSLESLRDEGIRVDELAAGYAVLVVPESRIEQVSAMEQIVYIEKPKRLFFASNMARAASCLSTIQTSIGAGAGGGGTGGAGGGVISSLESGLTGKGVLVAVIDSGIDYFHPDFRNPDGTTRIGLLADQDRDRIYTREEINAALETGSRTSALALVPSTDPSGHGTAVAAIAAGNGREGNGVYRGVAYESELMVVKLGTPLTDSFPRTTQLMKALDLVVRRAQDMNRPLAVNISFGNTYGSHDGTSLLETFINDMSGIGRNVIVAGTGNEGTGAGHRAGSLVMGQEENAQLSIAPYETGMGVQLWKSYVDQFSIRLVTPSGEIIGPIDSRLGPQTLRYGGTQILIYYGKPSPFSRAQEVYFDFLPVRDYLDSGIWTFRLTPERIVTGRYDMWLPSRGILNPSTRFLRPVPETTLTIPSTAANVISVGAYDDSYRAYADFSGRGFTRQTGQVKPDLAAPGVDIVTARRGGGYEAVTGTSFAAPFVTGSAALLMQWGILQGNDPFLYGEKVKAYFTRGARHLPGYDVWPNERLGYGTLCVRDSLPLGNS
ncbi:S8 family peptidase [Enterocloster bolteae]|uniref:Peptidase n=5 Tax=Bacillota TaxID=1239 RepID=R0C4I0_9FIRM|nr:S8 family peptidase [Enterocloster bolteae]ENZ43591.1 peptidase [Enterocloster bolteae 90B3]ENZ51477.1 peptidase [Enterocloster bolteae 90A9]UOX71552.1 S8 family serine peptidase [Enterocloster bolteae]